MTLMMMPTSTQRLMKMFSTSPLQRWTITRFRTSSHPNFYGHNLANNVSKNMFSIMVCPLLTASLFDAPPAPHRV